MKTGIENILRDEYSDFDRNTWHYERVIKMLNKAFTEGKKEGIELAVRKCAESAMVECTDWDSYRVDKESILEVKDELLKTL